MMLYNLFALAAWFVLVFVVAAVGAKYRPGPWYANLRKPPWNPPNTVFAPVWTTLYTLMSIAAWCVWRKGGWTGQAIPLGLFVLQLLFNGIWTWIFFGLKNIVVAFLDIVLVWVTVTATLVSFWHVEPLAGALLAPYLAWVSFAATLNYSLWRRNRFS